MENYREAKEKMNQDQVSGYFSGYLAFLGRPAGLGSLILSTTEGSYIPVGPAYSTGFNPALISLDLAALGVISKVLAISAIDIAFILQNSAKKINKLREFVSLIIDKYGTLVYRIIIGWLPVG